MPFLVIAGITVEVQHTGARQNEAIRQGSVRPSFAGSLRSDVAAERQAWDVTTGPMLQAAADTLMSAVAGGAFVDVSGDAIGTARACHVRVTAGEFIPDGLGFQRVLSLAIEEAGAVPVTAPPGTPPAAPTALAIALTGTGGTLTWADNSTDEDTFRVERAPGLNATTGFAEIGAVLANTTTYVDSTAAAATAYTWRVRARSPGGNSAYTTTSGTTSGAAALLRLVPGDDVAAKGGTFARAGTAAYHTAAGAVASAAAGVLRDAHYLGDVRHFLVEPQRTNVCFPSGDLRGAPGGTWSSDFVTTSLDAATLAPDGVTSATRVDRVAGAGFRYVFKGVATTAGLAAASVYAKPGQLVWLLIQVNLDSGPTPRAWINLSTGAVGTVDPLLEVTSEALASTGWRRVCVAVTPASGSVNGIAFGPAQANGEFDTAGTAGDGFWLSGAQVENGDDVTSYIATTTAAVTRAADDLSFGNMPAPQTLSALVDVTHQGGNAAASEAVYAGIGGADPAARWWLAGHSGTANYATSVRTDGTTASEATTATPAALRRGDRVRVRGRLLVSGGTVTPTVSVAYAAAAESADASGPAVAAPTAWGTSTLRIGQEGAGGRAVATALRRFVLMDGTRTLADLEAAP